MVFSIFKFQKYGYTSIVVIAYIFYALAILGLSNNAPQYFDVLDFYIKLYVGLFLLWRFFPYQTLHCTELDRSLSFSAGYIILFSTIINQLVTNYYHIVRKYFNLPDIPSNIDTSYVPFLKKTTQADTNNKNS